MKRRPVVACSETGKLHVLFLIMYDQRRLRPEVSQIQPCSCDVAESYAVRLAGSWAVALKAKFGPSSG
ncbi:MAG: hypothetical protein ACLVEJ_04870 [Parabacteroides sp.]